MTRRFWSFWAATVTANIILGVCLATILHG